MSTFPEREDVSILIEGEEFRFWSDLEIQLAIDTFSTVGFTAPFEPEREEFRKTFRPFSFKPLDVRVGGEPLFTGTLVGVVPKRDATSASVEITGYALPAVIQDCMAPGKTVPHEFQKLGLGAIATALVDPFGIRVEVRDGEGSKFDKVKLEEDQKLFDFLSELAKQRNLVLSNTSDGTLLCWRSIPTGHPVARLSDDEPPITAVEATFSPQDYFSEITGFASARRGRNGSKYTEHNPFLRDVLRPFSFKLDDTEKADAPEATRSKLGRMFANMASYTVENIPTWRDPHGNLWQPNTTVLLTAPTAMVYRETELLVRTVKLTQKADSFSAALTLVLPGAFSGEVPESLPWEA